MPEPGADDRARTRRAYAATLVTGLGGGLLAVLGASRPWVRVDAAAAGMPSSEVGVSGGSAMPWLAASALVVCASWLAVLATSGTPRRAVGLVSLLAALAVVLGAVGGDGAVRRTLAAAVEASPTSVRGSGPVLAEQAAGGGWALATGLGGLLAAAAATVVLLRGHRWPGMSRRYRSPVAEPASSAPAAPMRRAAAAADPADWWRELDEGRDPTR